MSNFRIFYSRLFSDIILKVKIVNFVVNLFGSPIEKMNEYIDNAINEDI